MSRPERALLLGVVFFTNLLALACQVIWVRKLNGVGLNTDDRLVLEFNTARYLYDSLKRSP